MASFDDATTVRSYKSLALVERAFRCIKTVDLQVRPVYHWLADRVRAHVFLCMLAYHLEWHMRERLAPMLFDDTDKQAAEALRTSSGTGATLTRRVTKQTTGLPRWPAGAQLPIARRSGDAGAQYRHHRHHPNYPITVLPPQQSAQAFALLPHISHKRLQYSFSLINLRIQSKLLLNLIYHNISARRLRIKRQQRRRQIPTMMQSTIFWHIAKGDLFRASLSSVTSLIVQSF